VGKKSNHEHYTSWPVVELRARWQREIFRMLAKETVYRSGVDQDVLTAIRHRVRSDGRWRDDYQRTTAVIKRTQELNEKVYIILL